MHVIRIEPFDRGRPAHALPGPLNKVRSFPGTTMGRSPSLPAEHPSAHNITVNRVYRRRDCVAALSQRLLDDGWQFCTLFTDLANPTSNSIYQRIDHRAIGDFTHYLFEYDDGG